MDGWMDVAIEANPKDYVIDRLPHGVAWRAFRTHTAHKSFDDYLLSVQNLLKIEDLGAYKSCSANRF